MNIHKVEGIVDLKSTMNQFNLVKIYNFKRTVGYKFYSNSHRLRGGKDGGGIAWEDHFLPHKFLKRTFQC